MSMALRTNRTRLVVLILFVLLGFSACKNKKGNKKKTVKQSDIASVVSENTEVVKYTITIYVDQPGTGGDRDTFEFVGFLEVDPGHAFVKLESENADGTKSTLVVGFYPDKLPRPDKPETNGVFKDDTDHAFEVQKSYEVTRENFIKARDYVERMRSSNKKYHVNDYNCADFVIQTAKAAGIDVPDTQGRWEYDSNVTGSISGGGSNPGDLGEDLR